MGPLTRAYLERKLTRLQRRAARLARLLHEEPQSEQERALVSCTRDICREATEREYFFTDVAEHLEKVFDTLRTDLPPNFMLVV